MNPLNDIFEGILKKNYLSITNQRKQIFDSITKLSPTSTSTLINDLTQIDRATIYRTIDLYIKLKIIKKIYIGFKYKLELSDLFAAHHHHFYCIKCHQIIDFDEPDELDNLINNLSLKYNFKSTEHRLEINGLCQKCKEV